MRESLSSFNNNENKPQNSAIEISAHSEYHTRKKTAIKRTQSFFEKYTDQIEPTAMGAIKLHIYNFLFKHPDANRDELKNVFRKINKLSEIEKQYSHKGNILPTIGIELEVPLKDLNYEDISILNQLKIHNEFAGDKLGLLWEVNPSFSYSPSVQSRIIQELSEMNALPLKFDKRRRNSHIKRVSDKKEDILSLHVNFGLPNNTFNSNNEFKEKSQENLFVVNDLLNYAFTSIKRLDNRKTSVSLILNYDAKNTKKNQNSGNIRLELRAGEFKDYTTYRMLAESQRIVALVVNYIDSDPRNIIINSAAHDLYILWKEFYLEVSELYDEHGLKSNMIDHSKFKVTESLKDSNLKEKCRKLITKYSKKVDRILKQKEAIDKLKERNKQQL